MNMILPVHNLGDSPIDFSPNSGRKVCPTFGVKALTISVVLGIFISGLSLIYVVAWRP